MTLTLDKPRSTTPLLRRLIAELAHWRERHRNRRSRARTRAALQREPDWQLEDIGVRRGNNPEEPRMRRGYW